MSERCPTGRRERYEAYADEIANIIKLFPRYIYIFFHFYKKSLAIRVILIYNITSRIVFCLFGYPEKTKTNPQNYERKKHP